MKKIREILLALGGTKVSPQSYWMAPFIVARGELMDYPVKLKRMTQNRCFDNARYLWQTRGPRSNMVALVAGYGLSKDDGMWRPHAWVVSMSKSGDKTWITETTVVMATYYGVPFTPPREISLFGEKSPQSDPRAITVGFSWHSRTSTPGMGYDR